MKFFYLSSIPNPNGKFEVHEKECEKMPEAIDRDYLGPFNNGKEALRKALQVQDNSICCESCCTSGIEPLIIHSNKKES